MDTERLQALSLVNKRRLSRLIEVIQSEIELTDFNRLTMVVKVPISILNQYNLSQAEAEQLCSLINRVCKREVISDPIKKAKISGKTSVIVGSEIVFPGETPQNQLAKLQREKFEENAEFHKNLSMMGISEADINNFFMIQLLGEEDLNLVLSIPKYIEAKESDDKPELDKATKKKLFILDKLKEEWDLFPKRMSHKNIDLAEHKWHRWMNEAGIDGFEQLKNILLSLQEEGLVARHEFYNEYA